MTKFVYLAGPIWGCNYEDATDWRIKFRHALPEGMVGVDPMRDKEFLLRKRKIVGSYPDHLSSSVSAVGTRDFNDVLHADMIVASMRKPPEGRNHSLGTMMELGAAHALRVPAVVVTKDPNILEHPLIADWTGWMVPDFDAALEVVGFVLGPYVEDGI